MSESVPNRIIFIITVLGVFGVIVAMMGSSFTNIDKSKYDVIDLPDELTSIQYMEEEIGRYANDTLTWGVSTPLTLDFSGNNTDSVQIYWWGYDIEHLSIYRAFGGWWIFKDIQPIYPLPMEVNDIIEAFDPLTNSSVLNLESFERMFILEFSYNTTAYNNMTSAIYDGGELYVWVGEGVDLSSNDKAVWSLVTSIIFFKNPDIHPVINFLFAIPFYAMFITIVFYVFTRFLEAVKPLG